MGGCFWAGSTPAGEAGAPGAKSTPISSHLWVEKSTGRAGETHGAGGSRLPSNRRSGSRSTPGLEPHSVPINSSRKLPTLFTLQFKTPPRSVLDEAPVSCDLLWHSVRKPTFLIALFSKQARKGLLAPWPDSVLV